MGTEFVPRLIKLLLRKGETDGGFVQHPHSAVRISSLPIPKLAFQAPWQGSAIVFENRYNNIFQLFLTNGLLKYFNPRI
jgi:hypothetical protein